MGGLVDFARSVWGRTKSVGTAILKTVEQEFTGIVDILRRGVNAIKEAFKREFRDAPATERERIERDLEEVNERIMRLRTRYYERGRLSESDMRENERLRERRADLGKELEGLDLTTTAEQIVREEEKYRPLLINAEMTHILQYHLGQVTFNKNCPACGRAMILQSKRDTPVAATDDFFWGCTGYYDKIRHCEHSEKLQASDLHLFVNVQRSEFLLAPAELSDIVLEQRPARVRTAMRDLLGRFRRTGQGIDGYRCPIHKERLMLREKRAPSGLLDQFFLSCPRYNPDGNGCNYVVKIKSPAQFSAVFESTGEGGLIQVTESGVATHVAANHGKHWNDELNAQVARAYEEKRSIKQIADSFQRNETSIYLKLQSMGKLSLADINAELAMHYGAESMRRIDD